MSKLYFTATTITLKFFRQCFVFFALLKSISKNLQLLG